MSNLGLYLAAVLIWGSTWLVITFQLGVVPPIVSVAWRFLLAAALLLGYCHWRGRRLQFSTRDHRWIALQGAVLFGLNYIGVYQAERHLASGLVAVTYSLVVFFNTCGMRLFFGKPIRPLTLLAAVIGVTGVALVFWPQVQHFSAQGPQLRGLVIALLASLVASFGNMCAVRNQRHGLPVVSVNAWAMLYGGLFVLLLALLSGQPLRFDTSWPYLASLLFMALFGSALAFGAYLTLMQRIGADRAAYTAVAIPVIALLLSAEFEQLHWQLATFGGIALCLAGNVLALQRRAA